MANQTVLVAFRFGTTYSQTHSSIKITRDKSTVLELPELKTSIANSKKREHGFYSPETDKLEITSITTVKRRADLSEF